MNSVLPGADGRLPAPDASFDVVTCVHVLEQSRIQTLMSEVRRVLVTGGLLVVTVPFHGASRGRSRR